MADACRMIADFESQMPKSAAKAAKALNPAKDIDDDLDEEVDRVTSREAYLFPILGSATLISARFLPFVEQTRLTCNAALFLAFKYLDKALINKIFSAYFALVGTAGMARVIPLYRAVVSDLTVNNSCSYTPLDESSAKSASLRTIHGRSI